MSNDTWNPTQYERFRAERAQPFVDLLGMVRVRPGLRVLDLGCGTGELTALLAQRLPGSMVEGIDSSAAMLAKAVPGPGLTFRHADIASLAEASGVDLLFSNAALQWVPDNEALLGRWLRDLAPGAQIAVQVPRNEEHASHRIAEIVAGEEPFRTHLGGWVRRSAVLPLERYAELLWAHGFQEQECLERIYGHVMGAPADVVEWVKGTLLTAYMGRLGPELGAAFVARYRERLVEALGEAGPYFYPFRRLLFWGIKV
ncbi:MAG: methyltransferase domain-containing protein [Pseudomonadota bacterium]|nr:methyltransferase domain-containing protein [Pseudomonadota bacterium]